MAAHLGRLDLIRFNAFSTDIAGALHNDGIVPPWAGQQLSHYATARQHTATFGRTHSTRHTDIPAPPHAEIPPPMLLPDRDAASRRAARQAAARRLREARLLAAKGRGKDRVERCRSGYSVTPASSTDGDVSSFGSSVSEDGEGALVGQLKKRGRKTGIARKRVFVLSEGVLYNYRSLSAERASWKLSMPGAVVGFDVKTLRIVVALDGYRTLVLYAMSVEDALVWTEALGRAAESGFGGCCCDEGVVRGRGADVDLSGALPENENWDSFKSFAKLQIRTSRTGQDFGRGIRG